MKSGQEIKNFRKHNKINDRANTVEPSFHGKNYLILKKMIYVNFRDVFIMSRSGQQYEGRNAGAEISNIEGSQCDTAVFDETVDFNHKAEDRLFAEYRHKDLDAYHSSRTYLDLPKRKKITATKNVCSDKHLKIWKTFKEVLRIRED